METYLIGVLIASIPTIHAIISMFKSSSVSLLMLIERMLILFCSWASVFVYVAYLMATFAMKAEDIIIYKKKDE